MDIRRELSPEEEGEFRQWARDNWTIGDDINPTWHPIVRDECLLIALKDIQEEGL
jgi:hypothetical protein